MRLSSPSIAGVGSARVCALGFSLWKRRFVREFLGGTSVDFFSVCPEECAHDDFVVWGTGMDERIAGWREDGRLGANARILRLEDGFLRSAGLGAGLVRPLSWVVDSVGIYYDARRESALERMLREGVFSDDLVCRARRLIERIIGLDLTKYNVGTGEWRRSAAGREVVLVVGQVESDASLAFGSPEVRSNLDLVRRVRSLRPSAWVVYKPHPDVAAGLRRAGRGEELAFEGCDEVIGDVPMGRLLSSVDEVHVMTSLAGFEGLLRGRRVVCHGIPFYAGWGLTRDLVETPRRGVSRTLEELVAATLIVYPRYVSLRSGRVIEVEEAVEELAIWRNHEREASRLVLNRWVRGLLHRVLGYFYRLA